ncbi:hypothetical protein SBRCBS47491_007043 [Sporothrix bragantina]|uniref:FAD-binding PCMH-type domain-containing protein n=1 Tax=Sporothrix bragantina TaxID=671064 RepID=A0ABP0CAI5_9PEZI
MNLQLLKEACEGITWIEPASSEYDEARHIYQLDHTAVPLAIVQPTTIDDVALVVKSATQHGIKFTVRGGGHHIMGRCIEQDTLTIDLRKLDSVEVASDRHTAVIGGGANNLQVARVLEKEGLATPLGLVATVGFVGWATLGGYGSFMNQWGLGVDNIVGAKLVTWEGKIIDANEEVLTGIRGAGGAFGIIVSLTVKVHALEKVLAGGMLFAPQQFKPFLQMLEKEASSFPPALQIGTAVFNFPGKGRVFRAELLWSSPDLEAGYEAIRRLKSLSPPAIVDDVSETALSTLIEKITAMIPPAYGGNETVSFGTFDDEALEILDQCITAMPNDPATVMALHHLSPISPSARTLSPQEDKRSSWPLHCGHTMIEIIGSVTDKTDKANKAKSRQWSVESRDALRRSAKSLEETYISMTYPGDRTLAQVYGSKWENLKALSEKYDPHGVFELAVPRIRSGMA